MRWITILTFLVGILSLSPAAWAQVSDADLAVLKARLDALKAQNTTAAPEIDKRASVPQQVLLTDDAGAL